MKQTIVGKDEIKRRLRYDPLSGKIFWRQGKRAGREAFTYTSARGYKVTTFRSTSRDTTLAAHRTAWLLHYGEWPSGQIDHINGNKIDNRIENLRDVVNVENSRNRVMNPNNTSGINGVYLHNGTNKWCAQISAFGKTIGLGLFSEKSDAIIARKAAERVIGYSKNHGRKAVIDE